MNRVDDVESTKMQTPASPRSAAILMLAVASLATAGIHFAVMAEHFEEYVPFGVFFSIVAWLQALWALAVVLAPTRKVLLAGLIGNASVAAIWAVSRTAGLPFGPEAGMPEQAAFLDVLSTVLEVGIVIGTAVLLARPRREQAGRVAVVALGGLAVLLGVLTTVAVAAGDQHGDSAHVESDRTDAHGSADHGASEQGDAHGGAGHGESDHLQSHEDSAGSAGAEGDQIDLGEGRFLTAFIDQEENKHRDLRLTFVTDDGTPLAITGLSVTGTSDHGKTIEFPAEESLMGSFAVRLDSEARGGWVFVVSGTTSEGGFNASFHTELA